MADLQKRKPHRSISNSPKTRIAIIGSGMAGLSAAWMLSREGFDVTVFEKGTGPGFAAHSRNFSQFLTNVDHELVGDVPSRMFNDALWPSLMELYRIAGIKFEPVDHQQTFYDEARVLLKIGLPYKASELAIKALRWETRHLLSSINKFREAGIEALESGVAERQTFGMFIDSFPADTFSPAMLNGFLLPALTSTVFTCPEKELLQYPCSLVLRALKSIAADSRPLMRTTNGSVNAAKRLLESAQTVRFECPVKKVTSNDNSVVVVVDEREFHFDHVVVATQANHASALVEESFPEEARLLQKFRYVNVPVVVHTDSAILPPGKKDWSTFNFDSSEAAATCTVWMNRFHPNWPETVDVFHSIFPSRPIDSEKVLFSTMMQRPVVDLQTQQLHDRLNELHGLDRRVWFAGSWAALGVPLLESAVVSSKNIVKRLIQSVEKTPA